MLNCDEATRLIAHAVEGLIGPTDHRRLSDHLERCPSCRSEIEAQSWMKRVLAERPDDPLPAGFAERLSARLDAEGASGWLDAPNWRLWSIRLLPVAAALLLFAGIREQWQREIQAEDQAATAVLSGLPHGGDADLLADPPVTQDTLIVELLMGRTGAPEKAGPR